MKNSQLVTFTEEILNGKLHYLYSDGSIFKLYFDKELIAFSKLQLFSSKKICCYCIFKLWHKNIVLTVKGRFRVCPSSRIDKPLFPIKIYNKNQYRVVTKLCGSKINEWKILINRLWFFISFSAMLCSASLHDPWWDHSHKNVFPLMFVLK